MKVSRTQLMLAATIHSFGMGLASFPVGIEMDDYEPRPRKKPFQLPPQDTGPVIDTTPESKRARRRRLARERSRP